MQSLTILITGASSGIGAELARQYAARGAYVALVARRVDLLETLAAELRAHGGEVSIHAGDVTRSGDIAAVVSALQDIGRSLDIVIANAGFGVAGALQRLSIQDYQRQFETNVFGVLRTVYETLGALRASRGRLVLMGSVAGHLATPGASAYAASKFAVRALSESLRGDLRAEGIGITLISPGFVDSDIRRIDNQGVLLASVPDPVPSWLRVTTPRAVRAMIKGITQEKSEIVITGHGKLIVFFARYFPRTVRALVLRSYHARPEPTAEI